MQRRGIGCHFAKILSPLRHVILIVGLVVAVLLGGGFRDQVALDLELEALLEERGSLFTRDSQDGGIVGGVPVGIRERVGSPLAKGRRPTNSCRLRCFQSFGMFSCHGQQTQCRAAWFTRAIFPRDGSDLWHVQKRGELRLGKSQPRTDGADLFGRNRFHRRWKFHHSLDSAFLAFSEAFDSRQKRVRIECDFTFLCFHRLYLILMVSTAALNRARIAGGISVCLAFV